MLGRRTTTRRERALSLVLEAALVLGFVLGFWILLQTGGLADFAQRFGEIVGDQFGRLGP